MKFPQLLLLALTTLQLTVAVASARLGENLEQCNARYGKETMLSPDVYQFAKVGIIVEVTLFEGKVEKIVYKKTNGAESPGDNTNLQVRRRTPKFSRSQYLRLLEINTPGQVWEIHRPNGVGEEGFEIIQTEMPSKSGEYISEVFNSGAVISICTIAQRKRDTNAIEKQMQDEYAAQKSKQIQELEGL